MYGILTEVSSRTDPQALASWREQMSQSLASTGSGTSPDDLMTLVSALPRLSASWSSLPFGIRAVGGTGPAEPQRCQSRHVEATLNSNTCPVLTNCRNVAVMAERIAFHRIRYLPVPGECDFRIFVLACQVVGAHFSVTRL